MKGWAPVQNGPPTSPTTGNPPNGEGIPERSTIMHAPMPLMATTSDAFTRQFYSSANLPQTRILPARPGGATQ